jgi:putative DNA base modification enzyme with NMAD domain
VRLHSYIVEHDLGFAPNPFHGICTLTACKPKIRKYARFGDYIIGTGTKKRELNGRLVYIMRVGEIMGFDDYWDDLRFIRKRPVMNGSVAQRYGDNVYRRERDSGSWVQEDSFHSHEKGIPHPENLTIDTGSTDRVLIGDWFIYWGGEGPQIPEEFADFVQTTQGHKSIKDEVRIAAFVEWASSMGEANTVIGDPTEWPFEERRAKKNGFAWAV